MKPQNHPLSGAAVITGAAQGIGQAIAIELARRGMDVALNDLQVPDLQESRAAIEGLGRRCLCFGVDVADHGAVKAMFEAIHEAWGAPRVVVSNAATNCRERISNADPEAFRRVLEVNQLGLFHMGQAAAQTWQRSPPDRPDVALPRTFIVVGSVHARVPFAGNAAYGMSKAAGNHFTRIFAKELAEFGVRVNAVNPGWTDTPGERRFFSEEDMRKGGEPLPLGRLARSEEIAHAVAFLCGPEALYITGSILDVDGGVHIAPETVAPQG